MKTLAFCVALVAGLGAGRLQAGDIMSPALAKMGLIGVEPMTEGQGRAVRGSSYAPMSADGGTFQVYFAHSAQWPYNTLPLSNFAVRTFMPLRVPTGGMGERGR